MDRQPSVTVIVPCYQAEAYVRDAIESVLAQDYPSLDVLAVDDGSTDGTPTVLSGFGGRIRVVRQPNRGVSSARNTGIRHAAGDLVMFLDADDLMEPGCVSARVTLLAATPEARLLLGSYVLQTPGGERTDRKHRGAPKPLIALDDMLGGDYCVGQSGMLVWRGLFARVGGFDPLLSSCEDWDWQIRALANGPAVFDPIGRVVYRQVPGSASRNLVKMSDGVDAALTKNRMFADRARHYRWSALRGKFQVSGSLLFYRGLTEGGLFGLLRARPHLAPYLALWAMRAAANWLRGVS